MGDTSGKMRLSSIGDYFDKQVRYQVPSGGLAGVGDSDDSNVERGVIYRRLRFCSGDDANPRSLILSHYIKLPSQNYELIDGSEGEDASENGNNSVGQAALLPQFAKSFAESHKWVLFLFACGLSVFRVFTLLLALEQSSTCRLLWYCILVVLVFALVFALAHASYGQSVSQKRLANISFM
jgi:hypothetical protein